MSQHKIIVKLSKKNYISPLDALFAGGGMKLATRIGELKQMVYKFDSKWHASKKYKVYKLIGEPKND